MDESKRLKLIWNDWSQNLVSFSTVQENNYLVTTRLLNKHDKPISFNLFFDEDGTYRMRYQKGKRMLSLTNIKEENLPAEILRFAYLIASK
ncbi:hypothetical protein [Lactobacillus sp. PV034]|uniref:hypothetical protein n=1 Tax=Lactobacillus sp. PV034 TaxID=2594495 RepID=UPI00223E980D|nr:hypothetical protein [Lactobacillus sp. PV034]QNQ80507.1 hypothetical protein FP432_02540 [Lactobacillus sp. PV034]